MVKRIAVAASLTLALGLAPLAGQASFPPEGCVSGFGQGDDDYTATQPGGIAGFGLYTVTVKRGETTTVYDELDGPQTIGNGAIIPGDVVTCSAFAGGVAAGNPLP